MEVAGLDGRSDIGPDHQVHDVRLWKDDALLPGQPTRHAEIEESFDLLVDPADRLNLPELVHRAGHGKILPQRIAGQARYQRAQLGQRRTIPLNRRIGLLEDEAASQRELPLAPEQLPQEAGQNVDALALNRPAQLDLAVDADDPLLASEGARCDSHRHPESEARLRHHGQAVDLPDNLTFGVDHDRAVDQQFAKPL